MSRSAETWKSRHPSLGRPYYAEYRPLLGERGVPGFEKPFSVDHFFEDDSALLDGEARYVSLLIDNANLRGCLPVLACCRSLGRAPWLRERIGGLHIVLVRDPRQQWYSGRLRRFESGQAYFDTMPYLILGKARWEPARRIARTLGIPAFEAETFQAEYDWYAALFGDADVERSYAVFYALWTLGLRRALPAADLVIDIDRLSNDASYRTGIERKLGAKSGLDVTFEDAAVAHHAISPGLIDFAPIERGVRAMLDGEHAASGPFVGTALWAAARARRVLEGFAATSFRAALGEAGIALCS